MQSHGKSKRELDLGERKVSVMNFSKVVTLPKAFTENFLGKTQTVRVTMSPDGRLTLTPVSRNLDVKNSHKKESA